MLSSLVVAIKRERAREKEKENPGEKISELRKGALNRNNNNVRLIIFIIERQASTGGRWRGRLSRDHRLPRKLCAKCDDRGGKQNASGCGRMANALVVKKVPPLVYLQAGARTTYLLNLVRQPLL